MTLILKPKMASKSRINTADNPGVNTKPALILNGQGNGAQAPNCNLDRGAFNATKFPAGPLTGVAEYRRRSLGTQVSLLAGNLDIRTSREAFVDTIDLDSMIKAASMAEQLGEDAAIIPLIADGGALPYIFLTSPVVSYVGVAFDLINQNKEEVGGPILIQDDGIPQAYNIRPNEKNEVKGVFFLGRYAQRVTHEPAIGFGIEDNNANIFLRDDGIGGVTINADGYVGNIYPIILCKPFIGTLVKYIYNAEARACDLAKDIFSQFYGR